MSTILETLESGLAVQACKLRLSTLVPMRIQLFLGQNVAAGLIGAKEIDKSAISLSFSLGACVRGCMCWLGIRAVPV
jgi:hypothetical protein